MKRILFFVHLTFMFLLLSGCDRKPADNKIDAVEENKDSGVLPNGIDIITENYNIVSGTLDIKSTEGNHYSASFLSNFLQSYELVIFGEMGKAEYSFYTFEDLKFLEYTRTDYKEPFVTDGAEIYTTRFVYESGNIVVYDMDKNEIVSDLNEEQQQIFNNALNYEQKIMKNECKALNWMDAYTDLIE